MPDHHKRVALVTGANRGIGYAISHRLSSLIEKIPSIN